MTTAPVPNEDLSYPIGKFHYQGPSSEEQRNQSIAEIEAAPAWLRSAVRGLRGRQLSSPYRPGGWTVRQVVHHVADSHLNAYIRFKLALTEDNPTIKPYEQERWAELADVQLPINVSLKLLEALHQRFAALLRSMSPADFGRTLNHPELGVVDLDRYLALYAWHGRHHVAHITHLRERMAWNR